MKKLAIMTVVAMMMAAFEGDEFAIVGKPFDINEWVKDEPSAPADDLTAKLQAMSRSMSRYSSASSSSSSSSSSSNSAKKSECDYHIVYFKNNQGRKGCAINDTIAVPAVFSSVRLFNCNESLFIVMKNEKLGMLKAFQKGYIAPCEYSEIDADLYRRLLYLRKPKEEHVTYSLDTGEKWDGVESFPPKTFPADIQFKDLTEFPYWKIESVTCIRNGGYTTLGKKSGEGSGFRFTIKGVGLQDWLFNPHNEQPYVSYKIFVETEDGTGPALNAVRNTFPNLKKDQPFKIDCTISDGKMENVNFTGIIIQ